MIFSLIDFLYLALCFNVYLMLNSLKISEKTSLHTYKIDVSLNSYYQYHLQSICYKIMIHCFSSCKSRVRLNQTKWHWPSDPYEDTNVCVLKFFFLMCFHYYVCVCDRTWREKKTFIGASKPETQLNWSYCRKSCFFCRMITGYWCL